MRLRSVGELAIGRLSHGAAPLLRRGGDAAIAMLNALVPTTGYARRADISYGAHPRHKLDIYTPAAPGQSPRPVVLFFYGGSWKFGERAHYTFVGEALARRGLVTAIADYRLFPEVRFPAFAEDGAAALLWLQGHVGEHGGDADALFVMGHSAGANIAALLALNPDFGTSDRVRGLIGLAGPYAFRPAEIPSVRRIFAGSATETTRPLAFAGAGGRPPPALLAHGRRDSNVHPYHTRQMAALLRAQGGRVHAAYYDGVGHIGLIGAFARPFRARAPVIEDVARFVAEVAAAERADAPA